MRRRSCGLGGGPARARGRLRARWRSCGLAGGAGLARSPDGHERRMSGRSALRRRSGFERPVGHFPHL